MAMTRSQIALAALALGLLAIAAMLVRELRRTPSRPVAGGDRAETAPLTDVAGPLRRGDAPTVLPEPATAAPLPALPEVPAVPPSLMKDPANPPHGTAPLTVSRPPVPPDPLVEPAIAQDPTRGGRTR